MRADVMDHYGIVKPFTQSEFYETEHYRQLFRDIKASILEGRLIAVCGVVGSGKTVTMRRLQQTLRDENRFVVSKSVAIEKRRTNLATLISALFIDLSPGKQVVIPGQGERRERELQELVKKGRKPVALFVDDAHELRRNTLNDLKLLIEVIADCGGQLSIVLAGHPKLSNDLRNPNMEEIGYRSTVFSLDAITGSQREYIHWVLRNCSDGAALESIFTDEAIDLVASKLRTPLQVEQHLKLALEAGYLAGVKPIPVEVVESVLSKRLDDLEPTLIRHGYKMRDLTEELGVSSREIKALFRNQLEPDRSRELQEKMLAAGLPI
jgi:type II secretory pathway predicted ATPase ExeA